MVFNCIHEEVKLYKSPGKHIYHFSVITIDQQDDTTILKKQGT